jgi:hypothetical protein
MLARVTRLVGHEDDPERLDRLTDAATQLLACLNAQRKALRAVRPPPVVEPPVWLSAAEVAALLHRSESTIRHMAPDAIPGRRQQGKGYKVEWNKQIVLAWLAECSR